MSNFLLISLNLTFCERNNAKIILLIIFYIFSLLFFLYQTAIFQKKEVYIYLYIYLYIFLYKKFFPG